MIDDRARAAIILAQTLVSELKSPRPHTSIQFPAERPELSDANELADLDVQQSRVVLSRVHVALSHPTLWLHARK